MSDILTASFCERCGTRREFRTPTGLNPLRKTRGFIGGLRHYLVSDEGLSDAMRDSMHAQESRVAAAQLDAFHESFHLCLDCRQYTCNDCWNLDAGRCRSCAPIPGVDDLGDRVAASLDTPATAAGESGAVAVFDHSTEPMLAADSWPAADHEVYGSAAAFADDSHQVPPEPVPASEMPFAAEVPEAPEESVAETGFVPEDLPHSVAPATEEAAPSYAAADLPEPVAALAEEGPVASETDDEAPWEPPPFTTEYEMPQALVASGAATERTLAAEAEEAVAEEAPEPAARPPLRVMAWDEDAASAPEGPSPEAAAWATHDQPEPLVAAEADSQPDQVEGAFFDGPDEHADLVASLEDEFEPTPSAPAVAQDHEAAIPHEPEPMAAEAAPKPMATEAEPEPMAADAEPLPEPAAQPPAPAPRRSGPMRDRIIRLPAPSSPPATPPRERIAAEQPETQEVAARRAQLEQLGLGQATPAPAPDASGHVLPYRTRTPEPGQDAAATAIREGALLWEASAREVDTAGVTVQSCDECGLALSASARFCRRCGARQAQSA